MSTGRLYRAEANTSGVPASASRGRLLRAELDAVYTEQSRGRLVRVELSASAPAQAVRGRLYRSEMLSVPTPQVPTVQSARGFATATLTATFGSATPSAWEWTQTSGPAVTLNGNSTATATFTAPALTSTTPLGFQVRALVSGSWTPYTPTTVQILPHQYWTSHAGALVPIRKSTRVVVQPPTGTPTPGLFFELPTNARTYTKKVFGHYFGPYPRSLDNKVPTADTYTSSYLNPKGESDRKIATGGLLRDRPLPTDPKGSDWRVLNCKSEIEWAMAAGIDGMWCDLLGFSGNNWDDYIALRDAAIKYYPGFFVLPMIDTNGAHGTATASQVAGSIAQFAKRTSSYYTPDNKYLVGSFKAEGKDQAWWQAVIDACKNEQNIDMAFCAVFLNYGGNYANYKSVTTVGSVWGMGSDANVTAKFSDVAATARSNGQKWMQCVQPQNIRPNQYTFDEASGTATLRAGWARAIRDKADYVQLVTWSDFSEGGQTVPSVQSGFVNVDLCAYYGMQWKTGTAPVILRDAIYLAHRNQLLNATPQFVSTSPMSQRSQTNMTPQADIVEVLTFLTAAANVTVKVGSNTYTYAAPAGEYVKTYPLANGVISANAVRGGASVAYIGSPIGCQASPPVQDRGYYRFSSLRPTDDYAIPTNLVGTGYTANPPIPAPTSP